MIRRLTALIVSTCVLLDSVPLWAINQRTGRFIVGHDAGTPVVDLKIEDFQKKFSDVGGEDLAASKPTPREALQTPIEVQEFVQTDNEEQPSIIASLVTVVHKFLPQGRQSFLENENLLHRFYAQSPDRPESDLAFDAARIESTHSRGLLLKYLRPAVSDTIKPAPPAIVTRHSGESGSWRNFLLKDPMTLRVMTMSAIAIAGTALYTFGVIPEHAWLPGAFSSAFLALGMAIDPDSISGAPNTVKLIQQHPQWKHILNDPEAGIANLADANQFQTLNEIASTVDDHELDQLLVKAIKTISTPEAASLLVTLLNKNTVDTKVAKHLLSQPSWDQRPEIVDALLKKGTADWEINFYALTQSHWPAEWVKFWISALELEGKARIEFLNKNRPYVLPEYAADISTPNDNVEEENREIDLGAAGKFRILKFGAGHGRNGSVHKVQRISDGHVFALKFGDFKSEARKVRIWKKIGVSNMEVIEVDSGRVLKSWIEGKLLRDMINEPAFWKNDQLTRSLREFIERLIAKGKYIGDLNAKNLMLTQDGWEVIDSGAIRTREPAIAAAEYRDAIKEKWKKVINNPEAMALLERFAAELPGPRLDFGPAGIFDVVQANAGAGTNGPVHRVRRVSDGKDFALKNTEAEKELRKAEIWKQTGLSTVDVIVLNENRILKTWVDGKSLQKHLSNSDFWDDTRRLEALKELLETSIAHGLYVRNLNSGNLIFNGKHWVIIDSGSVSRRGPTQALMDYRENLLRKWGEPIKDAKGKEALERFLTSLQIRHIDNVQYNFTDSEVEQENSHKRDKEEIKEISSRHASDSSIRIQSFLERGTEDGTIAKYVLSLPEYQNHLDWIETLLKRGTADNRLSKYVLPQSHWPTAWVEFWKKALLLPTSGRESFLNENRPYPTPIDGR